MSTAPYGIRLLVGVAVTALEETRRLPQTIIMYPMTVASTVAQIVMKMQQDLAGLAIRGDAALETFFPPKDEKPDWATFDEDLPEQDPPPANGERQTEGRFALYSVTEGAGVRGSGCRVPHRRISRTRPDRTGPAPAARSHRCSRRRSPPSWTTNR